MTNLSSTIQYLKACQHRRDAIEAYRAAGGSTHVTVSFTDDPKWLVNMAINRRAGWPDDPSLSRGSAMPVNGKYPSRAQGGEFMGLWRLSRTMNGTRIIIRTNDVPLRYRARLASRIDTSES